MGFAEEVVKYRKEANMTQEALAERCNVTRQAVAKWEKGDALPDVYLIARLASVFGVSIEELIWSKDRAIVENSKLYVRESEESDKVDFCTIMKEHRFFGRFLRIIEEDMPNMKYGDIYWEEHRKGGKIYVLRTKSDDEFAGYVYIESVETNAPQLTMQFSKQVEWDEFGFQLIRDLFNWISNEYQIRAIQVFVNSITERHLFSYFGYKEVKDEVILSLPV